MSKNGTEAKFIIFVSCIIPKNIKQVSEIWGYDSNYLYEYTKLMVNDGRIKVIDEKDIGNFKQKEKIYQTNWDKFWLSLKDNCKNSCPIFYDNFDELKEFYSGELKIVLSPENLYNIFQYRENSFKYFYESMPFLLCFIPILIRLAQSQKNIASIFTLVSYYLPQAIPKKLEDSARVFVSLFVKDNLNAYIPDDFVKDIYNALIKWKPEFEIGDSLFVKMKDDRLKAKKYDIFKPPKIKSPFIK